MSRNAERGFIVGQYDKLLEPFKIGNVEIPNRVVMLPMTTEMVDHENYITDEIIDFYEARAKGGVGLITVGSAGVCNLWNVTPKYYNATGAVGAWDDCFIPGWKKLIDACHKYGSKVAAQLQLNYEWRPDGESELHAYAPSLRDSNGKKIPSGPFVGMPEKEFTVEEIQTALRQNVKTCSMVPVLMGSGVNVQGFNVLLQVIDKYFPAPDEFETVGVDVSNGERFTAKYNSDVTLTAKVWKTIVDPFLGKYSLMKVCTGTLKPNTEVYNVNKETTEKIGKIYVLRGKESIEVPELRSGDIGAVAKLSVTATGDTMAVRNAPIMYHGPQFSTPYTFKAYAAENKTEEDKLATALARMMEEDKTIKTVSDPENRQSLIYGIGDQQLDVVASEIKERYNVTLVLSKPRFAYRETIKKSAKVQGRYKKQSGGHGQFGDVIM